MTEEVKSTNILYLQVRRSKSIAIFLVLFIISFVGRLCNTRHWILDFIFYGSTYFVFYLFSITLSTTLHERGHIIKLRELGYKAINFKVYRVGNVSFTIENMEKMSAEESYHVASAPFLQQSFYITELISLLILLGIGVLSPFPLDIFLLVGTGIISMSFLGSICAFIVIRRRLISGFRVTLARTVTSKGDIDEIVAWNKMS